MRVDTNDLVGIAEIAALAGVGESAVHNWAARYEDFPAPVVERHRCRLWRRQDVDHWLRSPRIITRTIPPKLKEDP